MTADDVTRLIEAGLPAARVRVLTDDDTHFEAIVIAPQFDGRRALQRYLDHMEALIHAVRDR